MQSMCFLVKFQSIKTDIAVLESKEADSKAKLLSDFNCKTVDAAYKKAEKLNGKEESLSTEIRILLDEAEAIIDGSEEEEEEE